MPSWFRNVSKALLPRPEDGNACHEAAFDPDQFPESLKQRLRTKEREQTDEQEIIGKRTNHSVKTD